MQTPLFWLDLSAYQNAELRAVALSDRMVGMIVNMPDELDDTLVNTLNDCGFKRGAKDPLSICYSTSSDERIRLSLMRELPLAQEVPFEAPRHLALMESFGDTDAIQWTAPTEGNKTIGRPTKEGSPESDDAIPGIRNDGAPGTPDRAAQARNLKQIVDTGEVRGVPIKDLRGNRDRLRAAVIDMTIDQQKSQLTKTAIWPGPNYNDLAADGMEPGAGYLLKEMRDSFAASIGQVGPRRYLMGSSMPHPEAYVDSLTVARDRYEGVRTLEQAIAATTDIHNYFAEWSERGVSYKSPVAHDARGEEIPSGMRQLRGILKRDVFGSPWIVPSRDASRFFDETKHRALRGTSDNTSWRFLPRNHALVSGRSSQLSEEQKQYRQARRDRSTYAIPRSNHASATRSGMPTWRDGDITAMDLIERFDLRGVEFGNWEGNADRQELLNQCYDAWSDMASLLDIDPKAIGLVGQLGMAFGSRGKGGRGAAAAHFEPSNNVINLTKMAGAGSAGHEWAHAFDKMGTIRAQIGRDASFATHDAGGDRRSLMDYNKMHLTFGDSTADNLNAVMHALKTDRASVERGAITSVASKALPFYRHGPKTSSADLRAQIDEGRRVLRDKLIDRVGLWHSGERDDDGSVDSIVDHLSESARAQSLVFSERGIDAYRDLIGDYVEVGAGTAESATRLREDAQFEITQAIQELEKFEINAAVVCQTRGEDLKDLDWPGVNATWRDHVRTEYATRLNQELQTSRGLPSTMYAESRGLDRDRSKPYWSRNIEMFARGFEAYLKEKLNQRGAHNDFLVTYGQPANKAGKKAAVYPEGDELKEVVGAFDRMWNEISQESKLSDSPVRQQKNGVVLFSLDGDRIDRHVPNALAEVLIKDQIDQLIGNAAHVEVHDSLGVNYEGRPIAGLTERDHHIIRVALDAGNPTDVANHEAYHVAVNELMTDSERAMMSSAFAPGGAMRRDLERALFRDRKEHLISAIQANPEEAQAYGYQYWAAGRLRVESHSPIQKVFVRIRETFESVKNLLSGHGYRTAESVFEDFQSGLIAQRAKDGQSLTRPDAEYLNATKDVLEEPEVPLTASSMGM